MVSFQLFDPKNSYFPIHRRENPRFCIWVYLSCQGSISCGPILMRCCRNGSAGHLNVTVAYALIATEYMQLNLTGGKFQGGYKFYIGVQYREKTTFENEGIIIFRFLFMWQRESVTPCLLHYFQNYSNISGPSSEDLDSTPSRVFSPKFICSQSYVAARNKDAIGPEYR
jgi:hypothetical protein